MEHKTLLETMNESFELLNPYQKADFLKDKLAWAAGGDLCDEIKIRLCNPLKPENDEC